ncbi:helix-turn-helix domain-containing protein [Arthrobacter sp. RT-1]|uniref:helix-turn-helix domain-containing protein n=1 Tax=Arthrobacter sp. RT-1 TaxID=2292263 RepID=UPI0037BF93AC
MRNAVTLIEDGEPGTQVARDLGRSRATLYRRSESCRKRRPSEFALCGGWVAIYGHLLRPSGPAYKQDSSGCHLSVHQSPAHQRRDTLQRR